MRILHTAQSYPPEVSGVAEVVQQISTRLARRGHEVHVATGKTRHAPQEETLNGVHVHRFDGRGNAALGIGGKVDDYLRFVRSGEWDVVAMHCAQVWPTDALLPHLAQIHGKKLFVGHGFSALNNPHYARYFENLAAYLGQMDGIIALSPLLEEVPFCAWHGLSQPEIIPNGVDWADWSSAPRDIRRQWGIGNRPWLLSVSNHAPVKGHHTFFEVLRQIRQVKPDAVGTIIGNHYPAAKWRLGRFGVKGGCWYRCRSAAAFRPDVILKQSVHRADVISAVQEADVVLVTSWREASPLVLLESMAAAAPWISFDVGCVREHVGGIVVSSPPEMVQAILELLDHPEQRRQLGQSGQARIQEKHDWEPIVSRYEQVYQAAMVQKG